MQNTLISEMFEQAYHNGDLHALSNILRTYGPDVCDINKALIHAASHNYLDIVRYVLTSSELSKHADIHAERDAAFRWACGNNHMSMVRYLLTSSELKEHADIHADGNRPLIWACENGNMELIRYLLLSHDLKEHANVTSYYQSPVVAACLEGHVDVVHFLLYSHEIPVNASITKDCYVYTCEQEHSDNQFKVTSYLLSLLDHNTPDFQSTDYNLRWAMQHDLHSLVHLMMRALQVRWPLDYINEYDTYVEYCKKNNHQRVLDGKIQETGEINLWC